MRPATRTLAACVVLSAVLGTIHAFSLFIDPFEEGLDAGRGAVSSVYSLALVALTLAVLTGHPLFRRLPGPLVALGAAGGAAAGLLLASSAASIAVLIVGYGLHRPAPASATTDSRSIPSAPARSPSCPTAWAHES